MLDNCELHNHEDEDCDVCHHKKFPEETIKEKLGDDVKTCCAGHGYIFKDNCGVINVLLQIHISILGICVKQDRRYSDPKACIG